MTALHEMLNDLEAHRLEVQLVPCRQPCNEGGMYRVVVDAPPKWYRKLCATHVSSREIRRGKFDTRVRRANILRALELMIANKPAGKYEADLRGIAKQRASLSPSGKLPKHLSGKP